MIPEAELHRLVPRPLDVESANLKIHALLADRETFGWYDIVGERPSIVDVLSAFVPLLALASRGSPRPSQPQPFAPTVIARESPREAACSGAGRARANPGPDRAGH